MSSSRSERGKLFGALLAAKNGAARSRFVARLVTGLDLSPLGPGDRHFDLTTLGLMRSARRRIGRGARVLDMGTGSSALLALWLWRRRGCHVVATDVDLEAVEGARENVARHGAPIAVSRASLFEGVEGDFDFVLFNPPYLPSATGRARGLAERRRPLWDGGPEGTTTVEAFLDAFAAHGGAAAALLGLNRLHVPRERATERIRRRAGVELADVDAHPWLPVDVYVLVTR